MNFSDINLNESIQKSLVDLNFINPTPIQIKAIPFLLKSNQDLISLDKYSLFHYRIRKH